MSEVVLAYVPVLHEGYRRFLERHARGRRVFVIGPELHADHRPLAKDVRALDAGDAAGALASLGIATSVAVLDALGAGRLRAEDGLRLIAPGRGRLLRRRRALVPARRGPLRPGLPALGQDQDGADARPGAGARRRRRRRRAGRARRGRGDRVSSTGGARSAPRSASPTAPTAAAANVHHPHPHAPYAAGDPRANFTQGVELELSTATHAEAGADRPRRPRRPRDRRRDDLRHRLPLSPVREADRQRRLRAPLLPPRLRGARRPRRAGGRERRDRRRRDRRSPTHLRAD